MGLFLEVLLETLEHLLDTERVWDFVLQVFSTLKEAHEFVISAT